MPDSDVEDIGGISVSVGASHARLVSDLAEADRVIEAWAQRKVNISIGANFAAPTAAQPGRAATPPPISFGPGVATRVQAQQGGTALQRAINAELAKTGEVLNANTGEVEKATAASRKQKQVVFETTQAVANADIKMDTGPLQADLQSILTTLREIVTTTKELSTLPAPRAGGSGGGGRRRTVAAAPAEDGDEGDGETKYPRIEYIDKIERQRRQAREAAGRRALEVNRSEQSLHRQRQREEARSAREQERTSGEYGESFPRIQYIDQIERQRRQSREAAGQKTLEINRSEQALSRQRAREEQRLARETEQAKVNAAKAARQQMTAYIDNSDQVPTSSTFAPQMTPEARAAFQREQERRATEAAARARSRPTTPPPAAPPATPPPAVDRIERERRRLESLLNTRGAGRPNVGRSEEEILEREQQRIATTRAQAVAAGRTARTQASSLGGLLTGRGGLIEAQAALGAANERVVQTQRRLFSPEVIRDAKSYRAAVEEAKVAETERAEALKKVESFSGLGAAARSLIGVTVAGAAFGAGLQAVGTVIDLTGRALTPTIDRMTGFGTVAGRVTDTLSEQTRAAKGNAEAVTSIAAANAGLSARAAATVQPLVSEQARIEASNKAMGEGVDLFQTYTKLKQQGLGGITGQTGGFLGSGFFGTRSTGQELGRLFQGLPSETARSATSVTLPKPGAGIGGFNPFGIFGSNFETKPGDPSGQIALFGDGLKFANDQLVKGGDAVHKFVGNLSDPELQKSLDAFAAGGAPSELIDALKSQRIGVAGLNGGQDAGVANAILKALNEGFSKQDPALLQQQFARQNASVIAAAQRQLDFAANTQQPVQNALGGLANPNVAVGTGISESDRSRVAGTLSEANSLQSQLNTRYAAGQKLIQNTYRPSIVTNFGEAAAQSFDTALAAVRSTGQAIAAVQEGISNEQAAYTTAQYNFQLQIAKRTLGDISGLTGRNYGVEQTRLGVLQRENLELSRQGQQLQFALSQRQINYQTAVAGFQAPGITPEERQANIKAAQIEASYAQKQLDIQREMFGNQVQIVDIGNLRQGADLMKQIALLQQGRAVSIDTAAAEQKILRLQQLQSQNVAQVSTYLNSVDSLVANAFGQIQQLEAAAGKAMEGTAVAILAQFGIFLTGVTNYLSGGGRAGFSSTTGHEQGEGGLGGYAQGIATNVTSPMRIGENGVMGEAGDESLIILSRPRSGSGFSGGASVTFTGDIYVRSEADIDLLARKVAGAMGGLGAVAGLRASG